MPFITPTAVSPGDPITSTLWNQDVVANTQSLYDSVTPNVVSVSNIFAAEVTVAAETMSGDIGFDNEVSITPTAASSKIMFLAVVSMSCNVHSYLNIFRTISGTSVDLITGNPNGTRRPVTGGSLASSSVNQVSLAYLDSPNTTNVVKYTIRASHSSASSQVIRFGVGTLDTDSIRNGRSVSTYTAWEIPQ
jgi:hypothetical protein